MAGSYKGSNAQAPPVETTNVWALEAAGAEVALVRQFYAGSQEPTNSVQNPFRVKVGNVSDHSGTLTALTTIARLDGAVAVANAVKFGAPFATAHGTLGGCFLDRVFQPCGGSISWRGIDLQDYWALVGPAHASNTLAMICRATTVPTNIDLLSEVSWVEIGG